MESNRQLKLARQVQKDIGEIFEQELRGVFAGALITVTKVHVTRDMSIARIYLSLFGVKDKKELLEKIRTHKSEMRYHLGNKIRKQVRIVPELEFFEDDSLDYIENIERLLKS
jgi:ribosome-binding factor A